MVWQPLEEKQAERELIKRFAEYMDGKIVKLQDDNDDGETDGIIEINGIMVNVEARRKGYPNHRGKICEHRDGWETWFLREGIFLNESTIQNYKKNGFAFIVEIKGSETKVCFINKSRIAWLLRQPKEMMISTNSGNKQSVKKVPLKWFNLTI